MKLVDTVEMMCSSDYKERFRAEYAQLNIRCKSLANLLQKEKTGEINFTLNCPVEMLKDQFKAMISYRLFLTNRAQIENIDIEDLIYEE